MKEFRDYLEEVKANIISPELQKELYAFLKELAKDGLIYPVFTQHEEAQELEDAINSGKIKESNIPEVLEKYTSYKGSRKFENSDLASMESEYMIELKKPKD